MPILFLIVVVDLIGFGIIIPLLPFYAEFFYADPATVGLIMATYSLTQFLAAPYWGQLSDRIGRRPVLLVSLAGSAVAYFWLGFADELWVLFAARALGGLMAGNISAAFAYVADVTTPKNRAKGMGMIGAAFGLGFIIGPAVGGILAGPDPINADYKSPAFAAAGLSMMALALGVIFFKGIPLAGNSRSFESPDEQRSTGAVSSKPAFPQPEFFDSHVLSSDRRLRRAGSHVRHVVTPPIRVGAGTERVSLCLCRHPWCLYSRRPCWTPRQAFWRDQLDYSGRRRSVCRCAVNTFCGNLARTYYRHDGGWLWVLYHLTSIEQRNFASR